MSAIGGPGPSSLANSPNASSPASFARQKKRVVNLVNPADPIEMLNASDSFEVSTDRPIPQTFIREATPPTEEPLPRFTPRGIDENGVRGILRSSGTPGSGNGGKSCSSIVRFFPKNRFRVITPNGTVAQPIPQTPPAAPAPSFFSSLLAVATMSPRRSTTPEPSPQKTVLDESWEQPGEEGELSLIGSSVHSDPGAEHEEDQSEQEGEHEQVQELEQEASWSGVPEQICSPLALPAEADSREVSYQELDMPSASMQIPEDMSNLLSVQMSPPPGGSFSLFDSSSRNMCYGTAAAPPGLEPLQENSWIEQSEESLSACNRTEDDNPTIRRRLSPLPSPPPRSQTPNGEPRSPAYSPSAPSAPSIAQSPMLSKTPETPSPAKPITGSIFADMSAELAQHSWPLADIPAVDAAETEPDESAFHSIRSLCVGAARSSEAELPYSPMLPPRSPFMRSSTTPKSTPGDTTEFFDAASSIISPSPCPPRPTLALTTARPASAPLVVNGPVDLVRPAKELFDAQSAQTMALRAELDLYRSLTRRLHNEVSERDGALADLQLRALEADMLRSQLSDVQRELQRARERSRSSTGSSLYMSPSPLAVRSMRAESLAADRTTVIQAETRDLEIRLAKALADQQVMAKQLGEVKVARDEVVGQLNAARKAVTEMDDRQRDREVAEQARSNERSSGLDKEQLEQMERLQEEIRDLREIQVGYEEEIERLRERMDNQQEGAHSDEVAYLREKNEELETKVQDLEAAEQDHEQTIAQLHAEAESARATAEQDGDLRDRISELEEELQSLREVRRGDEDEIARLGEMLEKSKGLRRSQDDLRMKVGRLEEDLERERRDLRELAGQAKEERERREEAEAAIVDLRARLQQARAQLSDLASLPADTGVPAQVQAELAKLRSESATKDLEIASLHRRKAELKDDREMLNIALDSKQQELELLKRKCGVRGVAGSTPLAASARPNITADTPAPYPTYHTDTPATQKVLAGSTVSTVMGTRRRSSAAYVTPLVGHGRTLRSTSGSSTLGKPFASSTAKPQRLLRRIEDDHDENLLPPRAERMLA